MSKAVLPVRSDVLERISPVLLKLVYARIGDRIYCGFRVRFGGAGLAWANVDTVKRQIEVSREYRFWLR